MSEVKAGERVHIKRHLMVDAVPFGPGIYEVLEDGDQGQMTVDVAKRVTAKQGNAEVVSKDASAKKTREAAKNEEGN